MEAITPSFAKRANVGGAQVLRVLDAEAAVARAVAPSRPARRGRGSRVRAVADGVDHDLEAGAVRLSDPSSHAAERHALGGDSTPRFSGVVGERLEEERGAGAERAVGEALHAADAEPLVVLPRARGVARLLPRESEGR